MRNDLNKLDRTRMESSYFEPVPLPSLIGLLMVFDIIHINKMRMIRASK